MPYDTLDVLIPHRRDDGNVENDPDKWTWVSADYNKMYEVLEAYSDLAPNTPIFVQMMNGFIAFKDRENTKEICPIAFMTSSADYMLLLESLCEKYHCLPYDGNIQSQPPWIIDAFVTISVAKDKYNTHKRLLEEDKARNKGKVKGKMS